MGPLHGLKIIELAGIGPAPFCGMMLADMGAEVLRIDRATAADSGLNTDPRYDVLNRGKQSIAIDLKAQEGVDAVLRLVARADALIEGFRPGVTERLGLGPKPCLARNPRLVYGRVTGWGQDGPMAQAAGHDINYIALAGVLNAIGRTGEPPLPPLNLVGDFGGGGMFLAFGILCAILEARQSGKGQVVDAAMIDGALLLMAGIIGMRAEGRWNDARGTNPIDTGAPFYDVYETADGKYVSIGAIEGRFFEELLRRLGIADEAMFSQWDETTWPHLRGVIANKVRTKTRDEWSRVFAGSDACFAPVLTMDEAAAHPHMQERRVFATIDGVVQPAPGPRFDMTPAEIRSPPPMPGEHTVTALQAWGFSTDEIEAMQARKVVRTLGQ